jgi:hypothetical protein
MASGAGASQPTLACVSTTTSYSSLKQEGFSDLNILSSTDAWVSADAGAVAHWDGRQWKLLSTPASSVDGMSAVSPTDIWAVGSFVDFQRAKNEPLIEHWDGRHWRVIPNPVTTMERRAGVPAWIAGRLTGVRALAANDVWAVGIGEPAPLRLHWDGTRWTEVPPASKEQQMLARSLAVQYDSVGGASARALWIVGWEDNGGHTPLIDTWDGHQWRSVANAVFAGELTAVSSVSPGDAWAVGFTGDPAFPGGGNLIEHWDGTSWHIVQELPDSARHYTAGGVVAVSARDVWAVGKNIEHWDGIAWRLIPTRRTDIFYSVAAAGPHDIWAVGERIINVSRNEWYPLVMRFTGPGC